MHQKRHYFLKETRSQLTRLGDLKSYRSEPRFLLGKASENGCTRFLGYRARSENADGNVGGNGDGRRFSATI